MDFEYFSQRLLNPFRGCMNVIRFASAEAVTTNGNDWEIYVSNDMLREGLPANANIQTSDIRYGSWSKQEGLRRGPIYPSSDFRRMEEMGAVALELVQHLHDTLPFKLADNYELWLLDQNQLPLVLLHSVTSEQEMALNIPIVWRAGKACHETFRPKHAFSENDKMSAAERLMAYVKELAGTTPRARWYRRDANANGEHVATAITNSSSLYDIPGSRLPATAFPDCYIKESDNNEEFNRLRSAFIDWLAPWLLLLPGLGSEKRRHLEKHARKQALIVESLHRLYPETIDRDMIKSCRVEAMMRKSGSREEAKDDKATNWYLNIGAIERGM